MPSDFIETVMEIKIYRQKWRETGGKQQTQKSDPDIIKYKLKKNETKEKKLKVRKVKEK